MSDALHVHMLLRAFPSSPRHAESSWSPWHPAARRTQRRRLSPRRGCLRSCTLHTPCTHRTLAACSKSLRIWANSAHLAARSEDAAHAPGTNVMEPSTVNASACVATSEAAACTAAATHGASCRAVRLLVCLASGGARTSSRGVPLSSTCRLPCSARTPSVRNSVPMQSSATAKPIAFHGVSAERRTKQ